eukprot:jgi/Ulvmu1/5867/UM025_0129.1
MPSPKPEVSKCTICSCMNEIAQRRRLTDSSLKHSSPMLAVLALLLSHVSVVTSASWSGPHILGRTSPFPLGEAELSDHSRKLLEEKPTGIHLSQVSLAATPLSQLLKDEKLDAMMSTDPGFSEAHPAQLVAPKRPLKIAFYDKLDASRTPAEHKYIIDELMPAAAAVLGRSIRIRTPSGILPFVGFTNPDGSPIAPPPANASGEPQEGLDADIFMEVTSMPADSEACEGIIAGAIPAIFEDVTYRPIFGIVRLCQVDKEHRDSDIATVVHELFHALGFGSFAFPLYPGYAHGLEDFTAPSGDGGMTITSPNVRHVVREHFQCMDMAGAEMEDDGVAGTVNSHWEERIFQGELLDAGDSGNMKHHNRHTITDLTLALLQDTNWYDVKYGSAGWNSYGYAGGCAFAEGTRKDALADPMAARYLCSESQDWDFMCLHDFSGDGICMSDPLLEGFKQVLQYDVAALDCQGSGLGPGQRCLKPKDAPFPECVKMSCSDNGKVLVNGKPCNKKTMFCPPDDLMCGDPGLLTCADTLNDCSGNGDCFKGRCYCHAGYGGDDCSVPVCYDKCADGSACPASGFCGVEECGTWSSGADDRGTACNTADGEDAGDLDAGAATDAGDGMSGDLVTSIETASADAVTTANMAGFSPDPAPTQARKPPKGMVKKGGGQKVFRPEDVPADIPDVMMLDGIESDYDYTYDYTEEDGVDGDAGDESGDDYGEEDSVNPDFALTVPQPAPVEEDTGRSGGDDGALFSDDVTADEEPGPAGSPSGAAAADAGEPCGSYGDEC